MNKIRIVGVPEHFNLPWHLCLNNKLFAENGLEVIWQDVAEGTGKMCQMLSNNETDLAIVLTEGIFKDIAYGNPSKIIQKYVESPLIWGVHTAGNSDIIHANDFVDKSFAISRLGSGSHLMSYVYANQKKWDKENLTFEIVNTIQGATEALNNHQANMFLWEKFMTKPLVDSGRLKRIDECPTPWPCFSIAVREEFLNNNRRNISKLLKIINEQTINFINIPEIDKIIAEKYHLDLSDVNEWLSVTAWSQQNFNSQSFEVIQDDLLKYGVIIEKSNFEDLIVNV
jgi:ABC-type nitrate/sulfonate/bicarbonate transport system substrate-binding protein